LDIKHDTSGGGDEPSSAIIDSGVLGFAEKSAMPNSALKEEDDLGMSMKKTNLLGQKKRKASQGKQKMITQIFNVIQLLQLVTLCCEGKSEVAEKRAKESVLSFKVSANIIQMAEDFWPLKIAIYNYISHCYIDSQDPNFMKQPGTGGAEVEDDDGGEEGSAGQAADETDIAILLKLVENLNTDFETYING
jgi:hypothetical protein